MLQTKTGYMYTPSSCRTSLVNSGSPFTFPSNRSITQNRHVRRAAASNQDLANTILTVLRCRFGGLVRLSSLHVRTEVARTTIFGRKMRCLRHSCQFCGEAFARASALAGVSKSGEGVEHDRAKREVSFGRASDVLADILDFSRAEDQLDD